MRASTQTVHAALEPAARARAAGRRPDPPDARGPGRRPRLPRPPLGAAAPRRPTRAGNPGLAPPRPPARPPPATLGGTPDRGARGEPVRDLHEDAPLADRRGERHADDAADLLGRSRAAGHAGVLGRPGRRAPESRRRRAGPLGRVAGAARGGARSRGRAVPCRGRPRSRGGRRPLPDGAVPSAEKLGALRPARRPTPLRNPAVRAGQDQGARQSRRLHAERRRPLPQRHGPAPLPERARAAARPSADRRNPGQPPRRGRPVDRHRDRNDGRRARHQHRQSPRSPRGDPALDLRGEGPPAAAPRRRAHVLHAADQRPVHRRAGRRALAAGHRCRSTSASRTFPARPSRSTSTVPGSMLSSRSRSCSTATPSTSPASATPAP